ncbi:MAG: biotin/lipoyl-binding protein, partial [Christensenellales bacterium]
MRQNRTASHNQKRRKWPVILGVLAVVILIAFAALRQRQPAASANGIRTARAETGSLSITVVGTGNLEYDDAEDIKIPTGIVVDEVPVESGDVVKAGDVLATFDPLSLRQEIESVRSTIDGLDRKIQNTKDKNETETVKAYVEGRVKRIYAEKGDSALDVYYEHGALMVLSIDGKMAVDFTVSAPLSIGEKVTVLLENGKTAEGTVEKAENGNITVTMTDNGPRLDETVTVQSKNGETLGSGKLYVRSPIRIVATDGRVKTVHVSENDKVSAGKTLVTLEDLSTSADYEKLLADRAEQMEKLDLLLKLSKTNALVAESGGVLQSVLIKE